MVALDRHPQAVEVAAFEDAELQRVQRFKDTLDKVGRICVDNTEVMFDDLRPTDSAVSRFRIYEELDTTTFYLSDEVARAVPISGERLSFEPRVSRGGKQTSHGVFFGDLKIGSDQAIPVAVKPHETDTIDSCLRDYLNNAAVRELGFHTPEPVGYIVTGEGKTAYSLSVREETLDTLDTIDWSRFFPEIDKDPGMQEIWREVSQQVAFLHSKGNLSHGDLAPRNIATSADGGIFLIDWEKANLSMQLPDAHNSLLRSYSDLTLLLETMCRPTHATYRTGIGLFYGKSENWWQGFCDIFYDEYCEVRRIEAASGARRRQGGMQRLEEVEKELSALTAMLQADIEKYQADCAEL